jgi:hypothetical protein
VRDSSEAQRVKLIPRAASVARPLSASPGPGGEVQLPTRRDTGPARRDQISPNDAQRVPRTPSRPFAPGGPRFANPGPGRLH